MKLQVHMLFMLIAVTLVAMYRCGWQHLWSPKELEKLSKTWLQMQERTKENSSEF